MENYPDKYIRGILNPNHIDAQGHITNEAFLFSEDRTDDYCESSINWIDASEPEVISFSKSQKSETGLPLFKGGIAILHTDLLRQCVQYHGRGFVNFERAKLPDNPYHGNILLAKDNIISKNIKRIILNQLALGSEIIK